MSKPYQLSAALDITPQGPGLSLLADKLVAPDLRLGLQGTYHDGRSLLSTRELTSLEINGLPVPLNHTSADGSRYSLVNSGTESTTHTSDWNLHLVANYQLWAPFSWLQINSFAGLGWSGQNVEKKVRVTGPSGDPFRPNGEMCVPGDSFCPTAPIPVESRPAVQDLPPESSLYNFASLIGGVQVQFQPFKLLYVSVSAYLQGLLGGDKSEIIPGAMATLTIPLPFGGDSEARTTAVVPPPSPEEPVIPPIKTSTTAETLPHEKKVKPEVGGTDTSTKIEGREETSERDELEDAPDNPDDEYRDTSDTNLAPPTPEGKKKSEPGAVEKPASAGTETGTAAAARATDPAPAVVPIVETPDQKREKELATHYAAIQGVFGNDAIFQEFKTFAEAQKATVQQLGYYKNQLEFMKKIWGGTEFTRVISMNWEMDTDSVHVDILSQIPGSSTTSPKDAYVGYVLAPVSVQRLSNAVFGHGNEFGEGKIGAPYVACSKIEKTISKDHVHQQIAFDMTWPISDLMTLNDTLRSEYGGLGTKIVWDLIDEDKNPEDKRTPWACLDQTNRGEDFKFNHGMWRLLPIAESKTIIWYGTESNADGLNAPDFKAKSALQDNIIAFTQAAKGKYGN